MRNQLSVAVCAVLIAGSFSGAAFADDGDDLVIETGAIAEEGSNISWGRAVSTLDKPIDKVLAVVVDYANYKQFMPNFRKSRILVKRGNRAMVYMEVGVMRDTFTLWGQLKLSERAESDRSHIIDAGLIEGNLDAFKAQFRLRPVDGGKRTEVDFRIFVDPDMPLPSSVFSRENVRAAHKTVRALSEQVDKDGG